MRNIYDFIIIGSGIAGCTFAASLNKRFSDASILLVERGRRLGGRATTRKSRQNKILEFDHGLPSISFGKNTSKDILTLILPLIDSRKLIDISNDILIINEFGAIDNAFLTNITYKSVPFMINFCEEIINQSINKNMINFLFETLIKSIQRKNDLWELQVNNEMFIKSKNLILSSSLIVHPRFLEISKIDSLPLHETIIPGKDKVVDSVIRLVKKQVYLRRKNYILYVSNSQVVKNFNYKYLQIYFSKVIKSDINFERVIFQKQSDGSMIIVLHCSNFNNIFEIEIDKIIQSLINIFANHQKFLDLFLHAKLIDIMYWRASQTLNHLLPKELQWSSYSNVGFCGDWFEFKGCTGVETSMNSSIRLANLLHFR